MRPSKFGSRNPDKQRIIISLIGWIISIIIDTIRKKKQQVKNTPV